MIVFLQKKIHETQGSQSKFHELNIYTGWPKKKKKKQNPYYFYKNKWVLFFWVTLYLIYIYLLLYM